MSRSLVSFDLHRSPKEGTSLPARGIVAFFAVLVFALVLTAFGLWALISQVAATGSVKSGIITIVLDLGLVLVGPVLLFAYVSLIPGTRSAWSKIRAALTL